MYYLKNKKHQHKIKHKQVQYISYINERDAYMWYMKKMDNLSKKLTLKSRY